LLPQKDEESENVIFCKLQDGPFTWNESQQGLILSSYYWGYLISQIPAGRISEVYSAKWVMFTAVILNIICTLLTPIAAQMEPLLMALRCIEGVGGVSLI
jgi:ACS family sodium-dependent inorganic phosphate cotransporter